MDRRPAKPTPNPGHGFHQPVAPARTRRPPSSPSALNGGAAVLPRLVPARLPSLREPSCRAACR
eukprot:7627188-Alexandrium_andersonii.AAC.1